MIFALFIHIAQTACDVAGLFFGALKSAPSGFSVRNRGEMRYTRTILESCLSRRCRLVGQADSDRVGLKGQME